MKSVVGRFAVVAFILVGLAVPAMAAPQADTVQSIVGQAVSQLSPFAQQRQVSIELTSQGTTPISASEVERLQERVINLLANAVAMSPTQNVVKVTVSTDAITVWVNNSTVGYSVDRNVEDQRGNAFRVRSIAGRGTELTTSLDSTVGMP